MLGNILEAQRRMNEGVLGALSPRRARATLAIRVSFEESRLAASCLATAYEQVLPGRHRAVGGPAHTRVAQDQALPRSVERTGT